MNDLIEYLLSYAFDHGIGYELAKLPFDFESRAIPEKHFMIINTNWKNPNEIPFIIGHEIGHLILKDDGIMYYASPHGNIDSEHSADLYSLNLLYDYSCVHGDDFQEPGEFMSSYGIPQRMEDAAMKLFDREQ